MVKNRLIILLLFISASTVFSQLSRDEKEILKLQDTRSGLDKLTEYLNSDNSALVFKSLYALANIADTNSVEAIGKVLLSNPKPEVRKEAAFSLGQIVSLKTPEYLEKALINEKDTEVKYFILEALGKTGNESGLLKVLDLNPDDNRTKSGIENAIAKFGIRNIKNEKSFAKIHEFISNNTDTVILKNAAYVFFRTGNDKSLEPYYDDIKMLSKNSDIIMRMWAFGAMGKSKNINFLNELIEGFNDTDWRIRINVINALGNLKPQDKDYFEKISKLIEHGINDESEHVRITLISLSGKVFTTENIENSTKNILESVLNNEQSSWRERTEAANSLAIIYKDETKEKLLAVFSSSGDYDHKAGIIRAFSHFENPMVYREVRDSISADVQRYNAHVNITGAMITDKNLEKVYRAFVEMLQSLDDKADTENQNNMRLIYSEFLGSKEPALVDLCIAGLMDSLYLNYRNETAQILLFDYNELEYPKDKDVMQQFINTMGELNMKDAVTLLKKALEHPDYDIAKSSADALKKITGKDYEKGIKALKYRTDFDWTFIESLKNKTAILNTNKGDIKIEFFTEVAPFTVQNFVKLAQKKFYDGTIFHRVVSNFVIQGGDPTGTGYGGPGHSIRSEFSLLNYDRGFVGMASSGKDTEGSQFFITHSPQPHLDSRYTIFGKVIEGMDVADNIMVGDFLNYIIIK